MTVGVDGTTISVVLQGIILIPLLGKIVEGDEEVLNGILNVSLIIRDIIELFLFVKPFVHFLKSHLKDEILEHIGIKD